MSGDNAEIAATIDFQMKYSGSVCPICKREIITLDELKIARFGHRGDVVHPSCWPLYALRDIRSIVGESRGTAASKIGRIRNILQTVTEA
jgi:hypothetical protein